MASKQGESDQWLADHIEERRETHTIRRRHLAAERRSKREAMPLERRRRKVAMQIGSLHASSANPVERSSPNADAARLPQGGSIYELASLHADEVHRLLGLADSEDHAVALNALRRLEQAVDVHLGVDQPPDVANMIGAEKDAEILRLAREEGLGYRAISAIYPWLGDPIVCRRVLERANDQS